MFSPERSKHRRRKETQMREMIVENVEIAVKKVFEKFEKDKVTENDTEKTSGSNSKPNIQTIEQEKDGENNVAYYNILQVLDKVPHLNTAILEWVDGNYAEMEAAVTAEFLKFLTDNKLKGADLKSFLAAFWSNRQIAPEKQDAFMQGILAHIRIGSQVSSPSCFLICIASCGMSAGVGSFADTW
jgi:hypothetical protein